MKTTRNATPLLVVLSLTAALGMLLAATSQTYAQTAKEVAAGTFPSVVLIATQDRHGQPLSLGSGFFVAEGVVATNYHVIEGAISGTVKLIGQRRTVAIEGTVGIDTRHDLVLLSVGRMPAPHLKLLKSVEPSVGETVYAIGNPRGLEGTFSKGIISGVRRVGKDKLLQITAPISPGSSGGPVLNDRGEAIGVAVATMRGGQNLNFAIPVSDLRGLIARSTKIVSLSVKKTQRNEQSILHDLGGTAREGVSVHQFDWDGPYDVQSKFTFSIKNKLQAPIHNIRILVLFYDRAGEPIEAAPVVYTGIVPPGLARRASGRVHKSVKRLTTPVVSYLEYAGSPSTKLEYRILDFEYAE